MLTLDVNKGTLRVKTDDVDHGIMCDEVHSGADGLRWCVSCFHATDEVSIEHDHADFATSASRSSAMGVTDVDISELKRQASPAYE